MRFQLVRADDSEIVVWHVDHGHIFVFGIPVRGAALISGPFHDVADAPETAEALQADALLFATAEARTRQLIGPPRRTVGGWFSMPPRAADPDAMTARFTP